MELNKPHSIKEFRVVLPMTVNEYQVGQLWSVAEASKYETGGGDGVEVLANEPFNDNKNVPFPKLFCNGKAFREGQYSHKVYHINKKVPTWLRLLIPKGFLELHEVSWNAYPFAKTVISNHRFMKESFYIIIETFHASDNGCTPNIHGLTGRDLQERKVVMIDIANDKISPKDYNPEWDPCLVAAQKAKRPAIPKDGTSKWMEKVKPVMCCYKLVKVWFKWFGMQRRMEQYILSQEYRLFFLFHRQVWCWLDNYYNLNMNDIRNLEQEVKKELVKKLREGQLTGRALTED